jgi:hypothetical protein
VVWPRDWRRFQRPTCGCNQAVRRPGSHGTSNSARSPRRIELRSACLSCAAASCPRTMNAMSRSTGWFASWTFRNYTRLQRASPGFIQGKGSVAWAAEPSCFSTVELFLNPSARKLSSRRGGADLSGSLAPKAPVWTSTMGLLSRLSNRQPDSGKHRVVSVRTVTDKEQLQGRCCKVAYLRARTSRSVKVAGFAEIARSCPNPRQTGTRYL